jgi:hypothetical protein
MDNITRTFIESFLDGGEGIPIEVNGKVANVEKTEAGKAIYHYIRTHYLPMKERMEAKGGNLTDAQTAHLNDMREVLVQSIYILIELTRKYLSA